MAKQYYSLFVKIGRHHYRLSANEFVKARAVEIFQNLLLSDLYLSNGGSLRPAKDTDVIYTLVTGMNGRQYIDQVSAVNDWNAGLDFRHLTLEWCCSKRNNIHPLFCLTGGRLASLKEGP